MMMMTWRSRMQEAEEEEEEGEEEKDAEKGQQLRADTYF
jgi:hypothetical protein